LTVACGLQQGKRMQMTEAFASAVTVTVPIFVLAAGAEARRLYVVERALAIGSALVWLAVFVLVGIAEFCCLVWLADGAPAGYSSLAAFSVIVIAVAMAALLAPPAPPPDPEGRIP
jgi:hypothetical protein